MQLPESDKIRFAVVGCGHIGKRHAAMIVENPAAAETFYGKLLDPMWEHSQRAKDTSQCPAS